MAVGLITAWPLMDSPEDFLIKGVQDDPMNRAETLFAAAKSLFDLSNGFEDSGLLLVQILCLMCIYTLTVSRRNTACSYHGIYIDINQPFHYTNSRYRNGRSFCCCP